MRIQNLKPALFLAFIGCLIGPELLLQGIFLKGSLATVEFLNTMVTR